jgi:TPP-dependent 2-oxoacid decarboxylase
MSTNERISSPAGKKIASDVSGHLLDNLGSGVKPLNEVGLQRGLKRRHLQMIALGSSIGTGLFLGSGASIQLAGPVVLVGYALAGFLLFLIMRMLGEMAVEHPVSGSFSAYAREFVGQAAGFVTGWNWWFTTIVVGMLELTAAGTFMDFWFPGHPHWVTALVALVLITGINLVAVGAFGELEFWMSMIKVVALVGMIVLGLCLVFGWGPDPAIGFKNLWSHGGFAPHGLGGFMLSLVAVTFTFGGIESLGTAAGETQNPGKNIPKAINSVMIRVLVFYVGGVGIMLLLWPWDEIDASTSPFVRVLAGLGIGGAAIILNVVVPDRRIVRFQHHDLFGRKDAARFGPQRSGAQLVLDREPSWCPAQGTAVQRRVDGCGRHLERPVRGQTALCPDGSDPRCRDHFLGVDRDLPPAVPSASSRPGAGGRSLQVPVLPGRQLCVFGILRAAVGAHGLPTGLSDWPHHTPLLGGRAVPALAGPACTPETLSSHRRHHGLMNHTQFIPTRNQRTPMRTTIGEYLLTRLVQAGVTDLIGVPGDFNLNLLEQVEDVDGIRFVGTCNELNAAYAADGYARSRGLGALLTTYGVGELSALNGIAGAAAEHVPMISIAGAPPLFATEGRYDLHHSMADGDFTNMLAAIGQFTAAAVRITPANAAEEIDRALHTALREKRPVHIQVPSDITYLTIEVSGQDFDATPVGSDPERLEAAVEAVLKVFTAAERPAMLIDLDADRHGFAPRLQAFAEATGTPYAQLSSGKAILDETHPLFLGTYNGALSAPGVREAVESADFLLTTTPRFIEANSGAFSQALPKQACVDFGDQHVGVNGVDYIGITTSDVLDVLLERVGSSPSGADRTATGEAGPGAGDAPSGTDWDVRPGDALTQERLWPRMQRFIREGDTVFAEAGTSNIGLGSQRMPHGVKYVNSGIWGSIGYTLPGVLGSQLADPDRRHLLFIGDGSLQLTVQELSTILREDLKPIIVVLDNGGYTIERWILGMDAEYNDVAGWDYAALPRVFAPGTSMRSYRARTEGELEEALAAIGASDAGALLQLKLDRYDAPAGLKGFGPATADFDFGPRGPQKR